MSVRRRLREVLIFASGFLAAGLLAAFLLWTPGVEAGSCQIQTLAPQTRDGTFGDATFAMRYKIPDCFITEGYKVNSVRVYNDQNVVVVYKK